MAHVKDPDCIFCKIIDGDIPCCKIYEDEDVLAFADINPVSPGHSLVIPKNHRENLFEMADEDLTKVYRAARKIAGAIKKGLGAEGVTVVQLNGRAANQVVMHYHVHLIPRKKGDGLTLGEWEPKPGDMDAVKANAEAISSAL